MPIPIHSSYYIEFLQTTPVGSMRQRWGQIEVALTWRPGVSPGVLIRVLVATGHAQSSGSNTRQPSSFTPVNKSIVMPEHPAGNYNVYF